MSESKTDVVKLSDNVQEKRAEFETESKQDAVMTPEEMYDDSDVIKEMDEEEEEAFKLDLAKKKDSDKKAAEEKNDKEDDNEDDDNDTNDSKFDESLVQRAIDLGLNETQVSNFKSSELLEAYLNIRDAEISAAGRNEYFKTQDKNPEDQSKVDTKKELKSENKDATKVINEITKKLKHIDETDPDYDTALLEELKDMREALSNISNNDEIKELRKELAIQKEFIDLYSQDLEQREFDEFDGFIEKLPEEYHSVLGKGSLKDIASNKEAKDTRDAIWDEKEALRIGYKKLGIKVPSNKVLFHRALDMVLSDKKVNIEKNKILKKAKKRSSQIVGKPVHKESDKVLSGEEKAIRRNNEFWKENSHILDEFNNRDI